MTSPADSAEAAAADPHRAKRERILAVSRTVHSIPEEEGGMLKRVRDPVSAPEASSERFWRRTALGLGGVAAGLMAGLWIGRRR